MIVLIAVTHTCSHLPYTDYFEMAGVIEYVNKPESDEISLGSDYANGKR
jgi:hypothetical protein